MKIMAIISVHYAEQTYFGGKGYLLDAHYYFR
jgi:hypothetical protein